MSQSNFTDSEWATCIKVLTALKDDPMQNPDNRTFKTLIKKIYKKARKIEHQQALSEKERQQKEAKIAAAIAAGAGTKVKRTKVKTEPKEQPGISKKSSGYFGF